METWNNKVVVVTGGSDGLGRTIGTVFSEAGAQSVLLARNESTLRDVCEQAKQAGRSVDWIVADVTDDQSVTNAVEEIVRRHGRIDVWVNNVGKSTRVKFEQCDVEQYKELMELNLYSAVRCTLAALDQLIATSGQIVNIGSLAAKTGWPNVAPYSVSKHALAAFTHQMRIEGPSNISCLFVCTGPIKRSGVMDRYEAQSNGLEPVASQPGAGVNLKGIAPEKLARKIVRACELRKPEIIMPWYSRVLFSIAQLSPSMGDFLLRRSSRNK
jgi:short-subunit dehydrogenase